jgi:hypothetical protein
MKNTFLLLLLYGWSLKMYPLLIQLIEDPGERNRVKILGELPLLCSFFFSLFIVHCFLHHWLLAGARAVSLRSL